MKVFLVDDEIVVREGIRESFPWEDTPYVLVGEAPDGEMALPMIRDTNPDIVITDIWTGSSFAGSCRNRCRGSASSS